MDMVPVLVVAITLAALLAYAQIARFFWVGTSDHLMRPLFWFFCMMALTYVAMMLFELGMRLDLTDENYAAVRPLIYRGLPGAVAIWLAWTLTHRQ